jgi:hypothetical protein
MEYSGWGMALTDSPTLVPPFTNSSLTMGFKLQLLPWMKGFKFIPPLNELINVHCTEPVTDVLVKEKEKLDKYGCSDFYQEQTITRRLPPFGSYNIQLNYQILNNYLLLYLLFSYKD